MENRTERLVVLLTPIEKKQLEKEAKEKNTTISLLSRKKLFGKGRLAAVHLGNGLGI